MARTARLSHRDVRGIDYAIALGDEKRTASRPRRPHLTEAVALHVGDRTIAVGEIPAMTELAGVSAEELLEDLVAATRTAVNNTAAHITSWLDCHRLLDAQEALQAAIRAVPLDGQAYGPAVRVLRARAGISRRGLARIIGHDRGTLAAWEAGRRRSGIRSVHLREAADALGFAETAIISVVAYLDDRPSMAAVVPGPGR